MKVKELIEIVEAAGYTHSRTKGDHRIFTRQGTRPVVIPGKLSNDIPIGTAKSILKAINHQ